VLFVWKEIKFLIENSFFWGVSNKLHDTVSLFWWQEAIVLPPFVVIAVRPRPGVWEYVRVNVHELSVEQLTVSEYLSFKEALVDGQ